MHKIIITLLLIFFIFSLFFFIFLYLSLDFLPKENLINQNYRTKISSNLFLRQVFRLRQVGDARSDYSSSKDFNRLEITIYSPDNFSFSENFKTSLKEKLNQIIDKPGGIVIKEETHDNVENITTDGIKSLLKSYPVFPKTTARLNIFVIKSFQEVPTYAGLVEEAYSIFLFTAPIENVSHFEKGSDNAYLSTILHEFAHLLGAGHVEKDGCLLSEKVEDLVNGYPSTISTTFCPEDLEEIKKSQ